MVWVWYSLAARMLVPPPARNHTAVTCPSGYQLLAHWSPPRPRVHPGATRVLRGRSRLMCLSFARSWGRCEFLGRGRTPGRPPQQGAPAPYPPTTLRLPAWGWGRPTAEGALAPTPRAITSEGNGWVPTGRGAPVMLTGVSSG